MPKPVTLIILDGWGLSDNPKNVLLKASLPTIQKLEENYPISALQASGISVGIPWGENGNSEVGHMTLGAGRIIYQNLPRITLTIQDNSFFSNPVLLSAFAKAKANKSNLHLMGLFGDGSVHSYAGHFYALLEMAKKQNFENVYIHVFTDGRDCPPTSGVKILQDLQHKIAALKIGKIASLCGRNWAMDRNNNWDRVEKAYALLTAGKGQHITDPIAYLQESYAQGIFDEYLEPAVVVEDGAPLATIQDHDSVIFFNFREDRAREITKAFALPEFNKFNRPKYLNICFVAMTEYEKDLPVEVAFPPQKTFVSLGEILSKNHKAQFRIAETEKYAHVTYFFNGGKEEPWPGEDRVMIPSPPVSKFDETPEMSALELTHKTLQAIEKNKYDFILMNYANPDMVAHTGNESACVTAAETIDKCLAILIPAILKAGGCALITADHGNIEETKNSYTGETDTEHSSNPVPLWYVTPENHRPHDPQSHIEIGGILSDVAPTILDIMGLPKPAEMTGESLLPILK